MTLRSNYTPKGQQKTILEGKKQLKFNYESCTATINILCGHGSAMKLKNTFHQRKSEAASFMLPRGVSLIELVKDVGE